MAHLYNTDDRSATSDLTPTPAASYGLEPTPEFMEAYGRAEEKYWFRHCMKFVGREIRLMRTNGDSICAGLASVEEQHAAVAAAFPHLYNRVRRLKVRR